MEDYSKVAVVKRNYAATLEKVRGAIRPTSLLWRAAPAPRLRERNSLGLLKSFWKRLQQTHDSS
jgi:hypothetical protein